MPDLSVTQLLWVIAFLLLLIFLQLCSIHVTLKHPNRTAQSEAERDMERYTKEAEQEAERQAKEKK